MKKLILITCAVAFLPFSMRAQDDMYFIPKKKAKTEAAPQATADNRPTYYRGLDMSVDAYNRRGIKSSYQAISDSVGNDIIDFSMGDGIYPDSVVIDTVAVAEEVEDYRYTNQLGRFDGFYGWYDPWIFPYHWYRYGYYTSFWGPWDFYDPWFYGPYGYYSSWYGPYGYYWGWDPWFYGYYPYYSYYYPYYSYRPYYYAWGGGHVSTGGNAARYNNTSTRPVHNFDRGYTSVPNGRFGGKAISSSRGSMGSGSSMSSRNVSAGTRTAAPGTRASGVPSTRGVSRSSSSSSSSFSRSTYTPTRSSRTSTPSFNSSSSSSSSSSRGSFSSGSSGSSGGSFSGGGRSGGSFSGGGRGRR